MRENIRCLVVVYSIVEITVLTIENSNVVLNIEQKIKNKQYIAWIKAINISSITSNVTICSKHFSSGKPANWQDVNNSDWFPHIDMGYNLSAKSLDYLRQCDMSPQVNIVGDELTEEEVLPQQNQADLSHHSKPDQNVEFEIYENDTMDEQKEFLRNMNNNNGKPSETQDRTEKELDRLTCKLREQHKRICILQNELDNSPETSDVATQTDESAKLYMEMKTIIEEQKSVITDLKKKLKKYEHHESIYENDDKRSLYYTGLPFIVLHTIFKFLEPGFKKHGNLKMGAFQSVVLTLMRMRLGLHFVDLGYRFNVSEHTASRVFHSTLDIMYANLKHLIIWPDGNDIKKTMPKPYIEKLGHDKLICIIDCFEIFVQRPGQPLCNCKMWSQYKHHQTIKFLIGMTPQGTVSFVSQEYCGRNSDNFITKDSGFLDRLSPGDYVAADRGFTVETELQMLNATLLVPTFLKGRTQLLPRHLEATRQLASYRIHIERIIGLFINEYRFFSMCLPMTTLYRETNDISVVDQMVTVCCALINLCPPIVFDENQNENTDVNQENI